MKIEIIEENDYKVTTWAGGKTTEFFLFPQEATYEVGKFDYRISSATIDTQPSIFSSLVGYHRLITPLENKLELNNLTENVSVSIDPYEIYQFEGSDKVESLSKCRDFNLIYNDKYKGNIRTLNEQMDTSLCNGATYFIYATHPFTLNIKEIHKKQKSICIQKGNCIKIDELNENIMISYQFKQPVEDQILLVTITKNQ